MQSSYPDGLLESILSEWFDHLGEVEIRSHNDSLALSNAHVWQICYQETTYCLKCWPCGLYSEQQLEVWHDLLRHINANGFQKVALPTMARSGLSVVCKNNELWDLTTWLPGTACPPEECDDQKLDEMLCSLAEFHQAASTFQKPIIDVSPGLQKRREILRHFSAGGSRQLELALSQSTPPWHDLLQKLFAELLRVTPGILSELSSMADRELIQQWCLRDVKCDHMLLEGGRVSGIVDYGAANVDSVACDLARLAGSVRGDQKCDWQSILASYESHRTLTPDERELIPLFHAGGITSASANWLGWLLLEKRNFHRAKNVQLRLKWLLACLRNLP